MTTELVLTDQDGTETVLTITPLDRVAYMALVAQHPPRQDEQSLWNEDTFPPVLIAACTGRPAEWAEVFWQDGEVDETEEVLEVCVRMSAPGSWDWATRALKRDPRLQWEMRFCNKAGISHSHFLGGPRVWTDDDQDLALAQQTLEADRCPGPCGMPMATLQDSDAGVVDQLVCVHCEQLAIAQDAIPEQEKKRVHLFVREFTPAEIAQRQADEAAA